MRFRPIVVVTGLLATAALAIAATYESSAPSRSSSPRAAPPAKQGAAKPTDPHGYPRTSLLYAGGPAQQVARYDLLVQAVTRDIGELRRRNPTGVFLLQPAIQGGGPKDSVHVTAPGGAIGWQGATDALRGGKQLGKIRAVDPQRDFLHNADGSLATIGKILGWNLAAPSNRAVPQQVAKVFAYAAKRDGLYCTVRIGKPGKRKRVPCWNGIHSDNWIYSAIGASWFYGPNLDSDRDGVVDDPAALRRSWSNGLTRVGMLLRTYLPGMVVGGNGIWYRPDLYAGTDPKGWLKASNYTLVEDFERHAWETPDAFLASSRRWLEFPDPFGQPRYMTVLQTATDISAKNILWSDFDPNTEPAMTRPDVLRSMRWGLTLALMSGVYYELKGLFWGNTHLVRWWFDEYDGGVGVRRRGYLGQAVGAYRKLGDGLYRRDFERGIAINNSSGKPQTVDLKGTFRKLRGTQNPSLNDGSEVRTVTIPAKDGIVLLRP
jgi:hypothetical protein